MDLSPSSSAAYESPATGVVFPGRLAIQQRVLPAYRAEFLDTLANFCLGGLVVFAGLPLPVENIATGERLNQAHLSLARNYHIFQPASPFYHCYQPGLPKWLATWQPDVLIVEANPRYLSTPGAVRWMHDRQRKVIGWGLGAPVVKGALAGFRLRSRLKFLRSLDAILAYSQRGAQEYQQAGFLPGQVFVAPNAVAHRPSEPMPPRPPIFSHRPIVLFVGRLQARKRVDLLIRACASLPEPLQPVLWIVGDGPERAALQALAQSIYPRAEFPGAKHAELLRPYFLQADVFVLPGTGGLAVQEAMSYGLPVIVAEGDGTQDDFVRPESGWRLPPGDLQALRAALQTALENPAQLRQMGQAAYQIVVNEANLEVMAAVFARAALSVMR